METQESGNIVVHDIRGQICPSCLLITLREINKLRNLLKNGQIQVVIKTDNRQATSTIPDAVSSMGYDHTVDKKDGYYTITIMQPREKLNV